MPKLWFAYIERKLHGPLGAGTLIKLPGFGPGTEVTADDGEEFWQPAKLEKFFKKLFKEPASAPRKSKNAKAARSLVCPRCGVAVPVERGRLRTHCTHCESPLTLEKGKGKSGVLAAVLCPSCGTTVEYPEASRTAHCAYCDSYLILLGKDRLYRCYLPPRATKDELLTEARRHLPKWSSSDLDGGMQLHYVPYWRYRAMVFYWNIGMQAGRPPLFKADDMSPQELKAMGGVIPGPPPKERVRDFRSRRLDRSMRASNSPLGFPGLGPRIGRMRLKPYDRKEMLAQGRVLAVVVAREEAAKFIGATAYAGLQDQKITPELGLGAVLNGKLSVVYLPFWTFGDGKGFRLILDGIDASRVRPYRAPLELDGRGPVETGSKPPRCIQARCARCGADLKIANFQALFVCPDCQLIWRSEAGRLVKQAFSLVKPKPLRRGRRPPGGDENPGLFLPVWRLKVSLRSGRRLIKDQKAFREIVPDTVYVAVAEDPKKPVYLYVQAWGNQVYPRLSRMTAMLTRRQPDLEFGPGEFKDMVRAVYDPDEARSMAMLTLFGVIYIRRDTTELLRSMKIEVEETRLLLLPCGERHGQVIEKIMGIAVGNPELSEVRR